MCCFAVKNFFPDIRQYCALIIQSPERPSTVYEGFLFYESNFIGKTYD